MKRDSMVRLVGAIDSCNAILDTMGWVEPPYSAELYESHDGKRWKKCRRLAENSWIVSRRFVRAKITGAKSDPPPSGHNPP